MEELTPRQREVLELIRRHIDETGYPPTRADIAEAFGFRSANAAEEHLRALARKGVLEIAKSTSRGIRLVPDNSSVESRRNARGQRRDSDEHEAGLPIIGRVAAGAPILAAAHIEAQCEIAAHAFRPRADYLLRVRGDSMRGIGIIDGDLLAVHAQTTADPGQVVVARIDDEVTVKRLAKGGRAGVLRLLAENPDFAPIVVDLKHQAFTIEGLAVGVVRTRL